MREEEAPRSPSPFDKFSDHAVRLFDLFSTIEAAVLYDRIYALPARLNVNGETLELRDNLLASGVLCELDLSADHEQIARLIVEGLAQIKNPVGIEDQPIDFDSEVRQQIEGFLDTDTANFLGKWGNRENLFDTIDHGLEHARSLIGGPDFQEFGRALISAIHYQVSGTYEASTSILRDMYHIYAAEYKSLPYWPNTTRVDFARNFPNFMERGTRLRLYARFARELRASLEEIREVFGAKMMFIPPFSAIVLDRSSCASDIPGQLLRLRNEFMWLRRDMEALEGEMRDADTFGKMQKVAKKQIRLSDTIAERFQRKDSVWIDRGIKYIPEMIKPALSPGDLTKYGPGLLLQPVEWLIDAFRKRPIAMFFEAKAKIDSISQYQTLIAKVFRTNIRGVERLEWFSPTSVTEERGS